MTLNFKSDFLYEKRIYTELLTEILSFSARLACLNFLTAGFQDPFSPVRASPQNVPTLLALVMKPLKSLCSSKAPKPKLVATS
jgi:hypothetical protein